MGNSNWLVLWILRRLNRFTNTAQWRMRWLCCSQLMVKLQ